MTAYNCDDVGNLCRIDYLHHRMGCIYGICVPDCELYSFIEQNKKKCSKLVRGIKWSEYQHYHRKG